MQFKVPLQNEHSKNGKVKANLQRIIPANRVHKQSVSIPGPLDVWKQPDLKYSLGLLKQ